MIDFDDWLQACMATDTQEATDLLWLALAQPEEYQRGLLHGMRLSFSPEPCLQTTVAGPF